MTPFAASSTVVNLILATGPYAYPYSYNALGPVISAPLLFLMAILAYITATYLVEALSIGVAVKQNEETDLRIQRKDSLFTDEDYKKREHYDWQLEADGDMKNSEFYIREKMELGILAEKLAGVWLKNVFIIILTIYVYGAVSLKYVTGAISLQEGLSFLFTGSEGKWTTDYPWTYYVSIFIFGFFCSIFSFGDIENSKTLQVVTSIMRVVVVVLMYGGTIYYLGADGVNHAPVFDLREQVKSLSTVFGNTVFIFIYHHSVPGIIYPVRP